MRKGSIRYDDPGIRQDLQEYDMDKELINEIGLFFNNRRIHNAFLSAKEGESLIQRIAR